MVHLEIDSGRRHTMVHLEIEFVSGPSCAASLNGPRARAVDAHRSIFTVWTLLYKHTYNYSPVSSRYAAAVAAEHAPCAGSVDQTHSAQVVSSVILNYTNW